MRTAVRILRGKHRGRTGWISGTLADRKDGGIGKALVKDLPDGAEFYALDSLEEVTPSLFETQKEPPPALRPTAVD